MGVLVRVSVYTVLVPEVRVRVCPVGVCEGEHVTLNDGEGDLLQVALLLMTPERVVHVGVGVWVVSELRVGVAVGPDWVRVLVEVHACVTLGDRDTERVLLESLLEVSVPDQVPVGGVRVVHVSVGLSLALGTVALSVQDSVREMVSPGLVLSVYDSVADVGEGVAGLAVAVNVEGVAVGDR